MPTTTPVNQITVSRYWVHLPDTELDVMLTGKTGTTRLTRDLNYSADDPHAGWEMPAAGYLTRRHIEK